MDNQATATIGVLDEFQNELVKFWGRLPNKAFFFGLLAAWLALFQFLGNSILGYVHTHSLFSWMYEAYNSADKAAADDSIGNFIPPVVLALFWWKRNELLEGRLRLWLPALGLVVAAMVLHVSGYVLQEPRISIVALFVGIYGLMGLAWGWGWLKKSFFPFFLFIFSMPLGNHSDFITFRLRLLVCQLVEIVCHDLLGIGVIREGTQLFDSMKTYQYDVVAACSGIRSLFTIFLMATVYGFMTFRSHWKRLFVMALAFPFAVLGNMVRLLCVILAATIWGRSAGDYVHEGGPFGIISLLPYVPVMVGVFVIGGWMEKRFKEDAKPAA